MAIDISGQLTGAAAPGSTISDFQQGEAIAVQSQRQGLITLPLIRELPNRKLYVWLWADVTSATDFFAKGVVTFLSRNAPAGTGLPVCVAAGTGSTAIVSSLPSVCTSGGNAVQDSIGLTVASPVGSQPSSVIIQPFYIYGAADSVRFDLTGVRNISSTAGQGVRVWMGVVSSQ